MIERLSGWLNRQFSDPQVITLSLLLIAFFIVILLFGGALGPALTAVVIAYLLDSPVQALARRSMSRGVAVALVYGLFLAGLTFVVVALLPLLSHQISQFVRGAPDMIGQGQEVLRRLPEAYPTLVSAEQIERLVALIGNAVSDFTHLLLSNSLGVIPGLITVIIYLFLVPFLLLFLLKDKERILAALDRHLPRERALAERVWQEVDQQTGNYVRGKLIEALIVGALVYAAFFFLDVRYAALLAVLVGLSVLVPFIGATVVTLPVAAVAFYQFGWGAEFGWVMLAYGVVQVLDGNVLVPLLFSEAVNLHPIAIIVAILFFGGLWGFWGVFFAIPLATLVKAVFSAWPRAARPA